MDLTVIKSKRKSISIEISHTGRILVRCPLRMSDDKVRDFLNKKQHWIDTHLEKIQNNAAFQPSIPDIDEKEISRLKALAKKILTEKTIYYAGLMNVTYGKITIRHQKTLWGSCSYKGNLNFNCILMLLPEDVQDYVVVHELSHRLYMDHSRAFWKNVAEILPSYEKSRSWLKTNGSFILEKSFEAYEKKDFYTYILKCSDNTYYTGYTTDLEKRIKTHNLGKGSKYTRSRLPVSLAYYEKHSSKADAQRRESLIKQLTRKQKENLINANK